MSDVQNEGAKFNGNLCSDEGLLEVATDLFNKVFGYKKENTQTFFFSAGDILQILSAEDCIGINVCPALDDNPNGNDIFITMALKPLRLEDILESDHKQKVNLAVRPGDPAKCCPTPGFPVAGTRDKKLAHWIKEIQKLQKLPVV
ncbi:hypothetical protein [Dyadobacter pollutisoli]|uniref:Uncharacterized protein n=1 Tax=Dyadobacter pollutisoli TaxID=2910158 RepID=A0A9E8NCA1_9BACT|nr:hypothetical protein [Dyadobacter pollutisoli]WAC14014.1 hypothetical protein ON006_08625 [Dyadobacter pollutisoli]